MPFISNTPWLVIAGSLPLIPTTPGLTTLLAEALHDIFDPRLRRML